MIEALVKYNLQLQARALDQFKKLPSESILFAIGNQVGFGQDLINSLTEFKSND